MNPAPPQPSQPQGERIRTIAVDDEPLALHGLAAFLTADPGIELVDTCASGEDAVTSIRRLRPDLVLLDVQMPGIDGFEVLRRLLPDALPAIVFVTAHGDHAVEAFRVQAIDYVLKPWDDARLAAALDRAKAGIRLHRLGDLHSRIQSLLTTLRPDPALLPAFHPPPPRPPPPPAEPPPADRILVKSAGEILFLRADEIDWIEAEGDYMKLHVASRTHLMRETMARLEQRLDGRRFVRIHRSTIVNLDRVRKLSPSFLGEHEVTLADGTRLRLGRAYQEKLRSLLENAL